MRHTPIKSVCCITAAAAVLFGMAGCAKPKVLNTEPTDYSAGETATITVFDAGKDTAGDKYEETTAPSDTTAATGTSKGDFPKSGSINGLNYRLTIPNTSGDGGLERGYFLLQSKDDKEYPYKVVICMGERSTGGYDIAITDIQYDGSVITITVRETTPPPNSMVTEAITYPLCAVELSGLPLSFKVTQEGGPEYDCVYTVLEKTGSDTGDTDPGRSGRLIATFLRGGGEIMHKTYVYELSDGRFRLENVRAVTESWGSPKWNEKVEGIAVASTRQEAVEIAKKYGSYGSVMYPGDNNSHPAEEFLANK